MKSDFIQYTVIMDRVKDDIDFIAEQAYERGKRDILEQLQSAQPSKGACLGCKHLPRYSRETPCVNCSNNYVNRWERNDKNDS